MIERIKSLMAERGINGVQLAVEIGLPKNAISEWGKGKAKPGVDAVIKIATYFDVTTDYLLTGNNVASVNNQTSKVNVSPIERILRLMEERNINALALTTELGFSNSAISDWKSGKARPGTNAVIKLAEYFGVTTDYLLLGKEQSDKPQMRLITNKKETLPMNESARNSLKSLKVMFRGLKVVISLNSAPKECKEKIKDVFMKLDINENDIKRWSVSDYRTLPVPSELQLKGLLNLYGYLLKYSTPIIHQLFDYKAKTDDLEEAINDYVFYMEQLQASEINGIEANEELG